MRQTLTQIHADYDRGARASYLLTRGEQAAKFTHGGEPVPVEYAVLYLSPATESGAWNLCPWASRGCAAACLGHSSGRMRFNASRRARVLRTLELMLDRQGFMARLERELAALVRRAKAKGAIPAARLNGTSDLPWHRTFADFDAWRARGVRFYDYTKCAVRAREVDPDHYFLTFSRAESTTDDEARALLSAGVNVAVVFRGPRPERYLGFPTVDGDAHDFRPADGRGVVVALSAKGAAKKDSSGFVVDV